MSNRKPLGWLRRPGKTNLADLTAETLLTSEDIMWTTDPTDLPRPFDDVNFALVRNPDTDLASRAAWWQITARSEASRAESVEVEEDAQVLRARAAVWREASNLVLSGHDRRQLADHAKQIIRGEPAVATLGAWHDVLKDLAREPEDNARAIAHQHKKARAKTDRQKREPQ